MSNNAYEKHLPSITAMAESLAINRHLLSGGESGPFSNKASAHTLLASYASRVAPKAHRKLTLAAYTTYLNTVRYLADHE